MPGDPPKPDASARDAAGRRAGDEDRAFEQYRMYVDDIGRRERLRAHTNNFYLSANAALAAALAMLAGLFPLSGPSPLWVPAGVIGLVLGGNWLVTILSYRSLAKAKWSVALDVEKTLPLDLYSREWNILKRGGSRYRELTMGELVTPAIFIILYALYVIYALHPGLLSAGATP